MHPCILCKDVTLVPTQTRGAEVQLTRTAGGFILSWLPVEADDKLGCRRRKKKTGRRAEVFNERTRRSASEKMKTIHLYE